MLPWDLNLSEKKKALEKEGGKSKNALDEWLKKGGRNGSKKTPCAGEPNGKRDNHYWRKTPAERKGRQNMRPI